MTDEIKETSQHIIKEHQTTENTPQVQAREWLTYLYAGNTTLEQRDEFVCWINSNEANQKAFRRSWQVWQAVGMTDSAVEWLEEYAVQQPVAPATLNSVVLKPLLLKPKHRLVKPLTLLSGIAASAAFLLVSGVFKADVNTNLTTIKTVFTSPIGQNRTITLSDGSDVTLAGNSSISVDINQHERRITLSKGGAYFDVVHDSTRVFSVTAQHTQVRVRGTAFEVKRSLNSAVNISVQRGLVDVADLPEQGIVDEQVLQLQANEQLRTKLDGTFITGVTRFNPETQFSWLNERFIYDNAPLNKVIMDINRYAKKPVFILDESINDLPITASFTFDQIDQMLTGLASAYPIALTEEETRHTLTKE